MLAISRPPAARPQLQRALPKPKRSLQRLLVMATVRIDIYSDISCPWCWVGNRRLGAALEQVQGAADVQVVYHAFIIDHATQPQGEEYLAYNVRRWGGDGWCAGLRRSGKPDGAAFSDWRWWPNSLKGHQLIALAQQRGRGREAKELLLRMTYEEGANVSGVDALVGAATRLGLPEQEVRAHLEADAGRAAVLAEDERGKSELGISGVPYFIVGGPESGGRRYALSGAQPTAALAKAMQRVIAEQQA